MDSESVERGSRWYARTGTWDACASLPGRRGCVLLLVAQQMIDDDQQAVTDRDNGPLFANAVRQPMILGRKVIVMGVGDGPHVFLITQKGSSPH
jgi:hypothetical protein